MIKSEQVVNLIPAEKVRLPVPIKQVLKRLPPHIFKPLLLLPDQISETMMSFSLNKVFKQPLIDEEIDFLQEKWLKLNLTDAGFYCFITVLENDLGTPLVSVKNQLPQNLSKPNVEFSADVESIVMLATKKLDPDTLFFQRKLMVTGETELGLAIKNFLDDFDFKESLPEPIQMLISKMQKKNIQGK
ncbi:hypothetical protein HII17_12385 [Thalassotalea sp. M1531]|uniref:SCP2 domain-containing protein n=1 Tax=Thalassotalea algicola TaxID=2716224 RepID=A0A7Y0Q8N7_9GAMM|nr:SCP2 sterol-binding domain-containing protein [Thalassotalea algicola]NMP32360.1 hypothetical protein [Thalassotalea algicola]